MPAGKDPKPKLGSKRGGLAKIGTMRELQLALWEVIERLKTEIVQQGTIMEVLPLKAAHTLATLAGVYVRLHEVSDLDLRMAAIEAHINEEVS